MAAYWRLAAISVMTLFIGTADAGTIYLHVYNPANNQKYNDQNTIVKAWAGSAASVTEPPDALATANSNGVATLIFPDAKLPGMDKTIQLRFYRGTEKLVIKGINGTAAPTPAHHIHVVVPQ